MQRHGGPQFANESCKPLRGGVPFGWQDSRVKAMVLMNVAGLSRDVLDKARGNIVGHAGKRAKARQQNDRS